MSDDITRVRQGLSITSYQQAMELAASLAKAQGFVPRAFLGQPHALMAAILTGSELGIGPMESLRSIHVIEGKPTLSAGLMLSLAIRAGVRHRWTEQSDKVATIELSREGFQPHTQSFSMEDARLAGLTGKQNWKRHPAAMLRARCLSNALRAFCPDVIGSNVYVEGEIEAVREPAPQRQVDVVEVDVLPEYEAGEHDEPEPADVPEPPKLMRDCVDEYRFRAWVEKHKAALGGDAGAQAKVVAHGKTLEIEPGEVLQWMSA